MKKALRVPSLILALVMTVGLATSCGTNAATTPATDTASASVAASESESASATPEAASESASEPVKLKQLIWYQDDHRKNIFANYIEKYKEKFPNVEVEFEMTSDNNDLQSKIKVYGASNEIPDIIFAGYPMQVPLIKSNQLLDLMPYVTKDGFYDKYTNKASVMPFSDGKMYVLNGGIDFYFAPPLYVNKDVYESNGLKIPTTFDEWLSTSKTLTEKGIVPIAHTGKDGSGTANWFMQLMFMAEDPQAVQDLVDKKTDWSNPAFAEAINKVQQMVKAGCFAPDVAVADYGSAIELFKSKKAAMLFIGGWEIPTFDKDPNVDIINMPVLNAKVPDTGIAIEAWGSRQSGYSVAANTKNPEAAVAMAEYCAMADATYFAKDIGFKVALDSGFSKEYSALTIKRIKMIDDAKFQLPNVYEWSMSPKTQSEYNVLMSTLMTGELDGKTFADTMNELWKDNYADLVD